MVSLLAELVGSIGSGGGLNAEKGRRDKDLYRRVIHVQKACFRLGKLGKKRGRVPEGQDMEGREKQRNALVRRFASGSVFCKAWGKRTLTEGEWGKEMKQERPRKVNFLWGREILQLKGSSRQAKAVAQKKEGSLGQGTTRAS